MLPHTCDVCKRKFGGTVNDLCPACRAELAEIRRRLAQMRRDERKDDGLPGIRVVRVTHRRGKTIYLPD